MRYGKIESRIWNDEKFIKLTPMQQRLFLYCLTCPHGNLIGLYVLKKEYIIGDLKSFGKDLDKDLLKLCESALLSYDFDHSVIFIKNYLKHNPVTNPNQKKAARSILMELPKSYLIREFLVLHKELGEGLSLGLPEVLPKPETDSDTETDSEELLSRSNPPADPPTRNAIPNDFEKFWESYPKKAHKLEALKAWKSANGTRPTIDCIIAKVAQLKRSAQWNREGGKYIPNPATWIRGGGWDDEVVCTNGKSTAPRLHPIEPYQISYQGDPK
jgi:hypothetical protein